MKFREFLLAAGMLGATAIPGHEKTKDNTEEPASSPENKELKNDLSVYKTSEDGVIEGEPTAGAVLADTISGTEQTPDAGVVAFAEAQKREMNMEEQNEEAKRIMKEVDEELYRVKDVDRGYEALEKENKDFLHTENREAQYLDSLRRMDRERKRMKENRIIPINHLADGSIVVNFYYGKPGEAQVSNAPLYELAFMPMVDQGLVRVEYYAGDSETRPGIAIQPHDVANAVNDFKLQYDRYADGRLTLDEFMKEMNIILQKYNASSESK